MAAAGPSPFQQWMVREWGGQPYVFLVPNAAAWAPPLPFMTSAGMGGYGVPGYASPGVPLGMPGLPTSMSDPYAAVHGVTATEDAAVGAGPDAERNAAAEVAAAGGADAMGGARGAMGGHGAAADEGEGDGEEGRPDALKLVVKLAFFVYILGMDGGTQRMLLLLVGAIIIFLAQTGRLNFLNQLTAFAPRRAVPHLMPRAVPPAGADSTAADGNDSAADEALVAEPEGRLIAIYRDVESVVFAFFASLVPSWRIDGAPLPLADDQ